MTSSPTPPRFDAYRNIHKALRAAMFDTVQRLGRLDDDAEEFGAALDQADRLLALLGGHVKHENEHIHAAIEAHTPGGARRTEEEHHDHVESIAALQAEVAALRALGPGARPELAHRLYLDFAEFAAENLQHMRVEELQTNAQLWALYSDAELAAIHDRLLASIEPPAMMEAMGWMARGLALPELAAVLGEIRRKAPAPAFGALLDHVRRHAGPARWSRLAQALALPAAPALA
jgi:hypothetical protein